MDVARCFHEKSLGLHVGANVNGSIHCLDMAIIGSDPARGNDAIVSVGDEARLRAEVFGVAEVDAPDITIGLQVQIEVLRNMREKMTLLGRLYGQLLLEPMLFEC